MTLDTSINEQEYIRLYQETSDQKYAIALYKPYIELVYGVCLKYYKNKADAEDAAMSVYELVARKLKTHQVENFKSWLYVVTKNYCFEKLRQKTRHMVKEKDAADVYSSIVFHPDNIDKEAQLNKLEDCLSKLSDEQEKCVRWFYLDQKSYQEIAEAHNLAWGKVRSLIQNGRRMLKNCMGA